MTLATAARGDDLPLRAHVLRTLRLAGPVMASRAGLLVMASVDTVMAGRAGPDQLAHYGIAITPQLGCLLVGMGLLMGTVVLTAQTDGAGRPEMCGRRACRHADLRRPACACQRLAPQAQTP
jgi:Na+-driven multidrug efflux pump